jgi:hypothetical protein
MKKLIPLFVLSLLLYSCKKENDSNIWEKSFGEGNAFFIGATQDSCIISCGKLAGHPYLVKLKADKSVGITYTSGREGLFSSLWSDTAGFIAAGSSNGKMLIAGVDKSGYKLWDTVITAGFNLDITSLVDEGAGNFLAVGSASPDSADNGNTEILFVRFKKTGTIVKKQETTSVPLSFISAGNVSTDALGNVYLAITRKTGSQKPRAMVIKYNSDLMKLWETELYNNPDFTAFCLDVVSDGANYVYATGKTEAANMSGTLNNSFLASLSNTGAVNWKKYLENSNTGSSVILSGVDEIVILNRNCLVIRKASSGDGSETGTIRLYRSCDSYTTDAFGSDLNLDYGDNFLAAGSLAGNYYIAHVPSH